MEIIALTVKQCDIKMVHLRQGGDLNLQSLARVLTAVVSRDILCFEEK